MYKQRLKANQDKNQKDIVATLRQIPGVSVETGHDDILVGYRGRTYWYEIKNPDRAVSKKSGKVMSSRVQKSQKKLLNEFRGHYRVVTCLQDILSELGIAA